MHSGSVSAILIKRHSAHPAKEAGQEAVEFALLLPLLLLIVFGVLDLGRAFHAAIVITNAARVGVRYGMDYYNDYNGIRDAALTEAQGSGIVLTTDNVDAYCIDPLDSANFPFPCSSGTPIRVTVTYDFTLILGFVLPDPTIQIYRDTEMMVP